MDLWTLNKWKSYYKNGEHRTGIRVRYEKDVDGEVKRAINECVSWMRENYEFPKRINLYVKSARRIKAMNGENVCGTFFRPADRNEEPYIRMSTGDYPELLEKRGKDNALASILITMFHELSHYYQWLNDLNLTLIGEERQATIYEQKRISDYAETRDHP
jgi:hypothetical protein